MWDIVLESVRTMVLVAILFVMWHYGYSSSGQGRKGWYLVITGWALISLGSALDVTDEIDGLERFVIIGDTPTQAFLEKFVGFLLGFVCLVIGYIRWLPAEQNRLEYQKSNFVTLASHELRTPLTAIYASLRLLQSGVYGELSEKIKDSVNISVNNAERLTQILDRMLDLHMLESGKYVPVQQENLVLLVREGLSSNYFVAGQNQVTLSLHCKDNVILGNVNAARFLQIINNLLSNAIRFSPKGGMVTISVGCVDERVIISVADQGSGIPLDYQPYIFQKFCVADVNMRRGSGAGVGLAVSKKLVEDMGGRITFKTQIGQGTVFTVEIPAIYTPSGLSYQKSA